MSENVNIEIILVQPGPYHRQIGGAFLHLPLQLLSLAAWLRRGIDHEYSIRIVDMHIHKISESDFANARIVGISAMTGSQVAYGLQAAQCARHANPNATIVWGGIHPSLLPEQTIANDCVDAVVIGEGEETFREVVEAVFSGTDIATIPGTCAKSPSGEIVTGSVRPFIDMNEMPLPAYDLVNMADYKGIEHQFDYQSSRGCPYKCGFCYNTVFCGSIWRSKNAEKVLDELETISNTYNVINFAMADDEFFINRKRSITLFEEILKRKLNFGIIASCRLDIVQKFSSSTLATFKEAGVLQMFFGAESGCDATLHHIHKDITGEDILNGARMVAEAGIRPNLSFMSGFPGETSAHFDKTLDIIQKLWQIHPLITVNGIFPFNAYPGTALFDESIEMGLLPPQSLTEWGKWNFQYEPDNPWLDNKMKRKMQISFYIVRFRYYLSRYEDRHKNSIQVFLLKAIVTPLRLSAKIRWSTRWFRLAYEWRLFAWLARKTFGYL